MTRELIKSAAMKPVGPGSTVWLASYPKSGNTWMRAIITALETHSHLFGVDHLSSGSQPFSVNAALSVYGLDPRWLTVDEVDQLRTELVIRTSQRDEESSVAGDTVNDPPILRKTHEVYRAGAPGAEPFPLEATRAAILVVRDPRDVACSYTPHFGVDLDGAIDALATEPVAGRADPAHGRTSQPWGSWSSHVRSWLSPDVPFPVHLVRYEDVRRDAVGTLEPVFAAIGLNCTRDDLAGAVERARFERLRDEEVQQGFRETSPRTTVFFRSGRAGGWREELSQDQIATIEIDHHGVMRELGYELETSPLTMTPLPKHLGLRVRLGRVPESIEGAENPVKWISTTQSKTIVRFAEDKGLMVEDGTRVTLQWPDDPDDVSWVLQSWAITLSTLQRGEFTLHASTVVINDTVVALSGRSGAGKSTTCMALRNRGHQLLVDDTTLVRFQDDGVYTTPYSRNVHLLPDAAEALGLDFDQLPRLAGGRVKASFKPDEPPLEPRRIDRIVVLNPSEECVEPVLTEVRGLQRLALLRAQVSRSSLAPAVLGRERYFQLLTDLADAVPIFELQRPIEGWSLDTVIELIEGS